MRTLLLIAVVGVLAQGGKPQAFYSRATDKVIATYVADLDTVRITPYAPVTLKVCMREVCKTVDEWTKRP
jgi:hypothetical protein